MARRTMPVSMLAESTKDKFSKAELELRQEKEQEIKQIFNKSDRLENKMYNCCDRLERLFFNEIKATLEVTGTYTKVDSITISSLANVMAILFQSKVTLKNEGLMINNKPHPILKVIQQYTMLQNQLFKELAISISERGKLADMTNDGEFVATELENIDALLNEYLGD